MLNGEADRRESCSLLELSRPNVQLNNIKCDKTTWPSCWQRWRRLRCHTVVQQSAAVRRTTTSYSEQRDEEVVPVCDRRRSRALRDPTTTEPCPDFPPRTRSAARRRLAPDRRHCLGRNLQCNPCGDDLEFPTGRSLALHSKHIVIL